MKKKIAQPLNYPEACKYISTKIKELLGDNLISVVIFGSYAMLIPTLYSDVDTLVVVRELTQKTERAGRNSN